MPAHEAVRMGVVRQWPAFWPPSADVVELAASEIVTNALIHAGSDVDLRLRIFEDHLRLEVRDSDTNPPIPSALSLTEDEAPEAEHGRGMLIVESLADEWTSYPNGQGKTVALKLVIPQL
ncbi:ATP-binding protein [Streptomyces nigra]|uniref:ATP-binding protein n=1 Tax=Streptomyces nigra TaxID=1827580 RepID=UPI0036336FB9